MKVLYYIQYACKFSYTRILHILIKYVYTVVFNMDTIDVYLVVVRLNHVYRNEYIYVLVVDLEFIMKQKKQIMNMNGTNIKRWMHYYNPFLYAWCVQCNMMKSYRFSVHYVWLHIIVIGFYKIFSNDKYQWIIIICFLLRVQFNLFYFKMSWNFFKINDMVTFCNNLHHFIGFIYIKICFFFRE